MDQIIVRQTALYTVTTDGSCYYVNGNRAMPRSAPKGSALALLIDTGCTGANGKRDLVGLTADQVAIHKNAVKARDASIAATISIPVQRVTKTQAAMLRTFGATR